MVEDIRTAGLRRSKLKNNGEEDPIVVIQRLLNIFRQLHVMNDEQKTAFNNLILQQPVEIRHMCAVLPGGTLLQEYVDELEEQSGQVSDFGTSFEAAPVTPETKPEILASAMAQTAAPATAAAPAPTVIQTVDSGIGRELQKQMTLIMQELQDTKKDLARVNQQAQTAAAMQAAASGQTAAQPVVVQTASEPATLIADEKFAKEIANAVGNALSVAEEARKKETQELTKTIVDTQAQFSKETQELTKTLADSQMKMTQKLVEELASRPVNITENPVARTVSDNGSEGKTVYVQGGADTKEITRAITESQLEMAKMFLQHNAISANAQNNNANNIQINNTPATVTINNEEIISGIVKAQSQLFQEMSKTQTKELSAIIASALKESQQISTKSMITALRETQQSSTKSLIETLKAFQKENLKFFEKQAKLMPKATVVQAAYPVAAENIVRENAYPQENPDENESKTSYIKSVLTKNFSKLMHRDGDITLATDDDIMPSEETDFTTESDISDRADNMPIADMQPETDGRFNEDYSQPEPAQPEYDESGIQPSTDFSGEETTEELLPVDHDAENLLTDDTGLKDDDITSLSDLHIDTETKKKKKRKRKKKNKNLSLSDDTDGLIETQNFGRILPTEELSAIAPSEDSAYTLDTSLFELDAETSATESNTLPSADDDFDFTLPADEVSVADSELPDTVSEESAAEEETTDISTSAFEDISEIPVSDTTDTETASDFDVPSEPTVKHSSFIPDTTTTDDLYALYDENSLLQNTDEQINLDDAETVEAASDEEEEWTWEYEEETDAVPENADASEGSETGEWEWEYEEEDENAVNAEEAAAAEQDGEGTEWEWEYEEDDTSGSDASDTQDLSENSEDGEWEWEYEEVDEDGNPISEQSAEENSEDTEWEWEYEEDDTPQTEDISVSEQDESFSENENGDEDISLPNSDIK